MRTKILLASAAALAAGVLASNAQVYSANIVGYVNVVYPAGQFVMSANPLTTGNDVITNVITSPTGATYAYIWNGAGWVTYQYSALSKTWKNGTINGNNTPLPPGVGYFVSSGGAGFTNTYVGSVLAATGGGTATNALALGYSPVGSVIPYADVVTNAATINLQVAGASYLDKWNVSAQAFQPLFQYSALSHNWKQGSTVTNPVVNVAEGFFVSPSAPTNWVETLQ